jgi:chromosome segregation ATPase/DNA-binding NarL/FixJ family response regulator
MKRSVLIESDPALVDAVRTALQPLGVSVAVVPVGEGALERCKSPIPDLIILSAELPDMSGFSVCNRIKRALPEIPLVLYTSEATQGAVEAHRASRTRANEYLRKPFEMPDLVGRVARLLGLTGGDEAPMEVGDEELLPLEGEVPLAPIPPPIPERPRTARREVVDPFADPPRDPAPPKGGPEQKLEYFRDRLRVKDTFLAKVREAWGTLREELNELHQECEGLRRDLSAEAEGRAALEATIRQMNEAAQATKARLVEMERQAQEVGATIKAAEEATAEAHRAREEAEQAGSLKLAAAEEARAQQEAQRREDQLGFEQTLEARRVTWEGEREDLSRRLMRLQEEFDRLSAEKGAISAQLEQAGAALDSTRAQAAQDLEGALSALEEARHRAQSLAGELADQTARREAVEAQLKQLSDSQASLEGSLRQAQADARAHASRASTAEQSLDARNKELKAAERQAEEMAAALDEGKASVQGVQGEVSRLQSELAVATRKEAQLASEREQLVEKVRSEGAAREEAESTVGQLQGELDRVKQSIAANGDPARLKRTLARAEEVLQQKTREAQASAQAAKEAVAERERIQDELAGQIANLASQLARKESELTALRRKMAQAEAAGGQEESRRMAAELDAQRRAHMQETVELERRHVAEVSRLKGVMGELEKHLETRARLEAKLRRRIEELEEEPTAPGAVVDGNVEKLQQDLDELRGENDFLNAEVARYHQKNRDLLAVIKKLRVQIE